jgi:predicted ArsR family transcriptional regulator
MKDCAFLGTVKETKEATDKEAIDAVLTDEGQSADAIAQAAGLPAGTVRVRLEAMLKDGLVERTGGGRRGNPHLWSKIIPHEKSPYSAETNTATWEDLS